MADARFEALLQDQRVIHPPEARNLSNHQAKVSRRSTCVCGTLALKRATDLQRNTRKTKARKSNAERSDPWLEIRVDQRAQQVGGVSGCTAAGVVGRFVDADGAVGVQCQGRGDGGLCDACDRPQHTYEPDGNPANT